MTEMNRATADVINQPNEGNTNLSAYLDIVKSGAANLGPELQERH
jgi:hypothetical protein